MVMERVDATHTIEMCRIFPALFPAILSPAPSIPAREVDASLFLTCFIFVCFLPLSLWVLSVA